MRLPAKLSWVNWPEKLSGPVSGRQAPGSPLPSIHQVKLQSPQRRERKKQLTEKNKTGSVEDGTGRDGVPRTSLSGFTKNPKSQLQDHTTSLPLGSADCRSPQHRGGLRGSPRQLRRASAGGVVATARVRLPQSGTQTSLPRTARCGSSEPYFKISYRLRQHTHGTYSTQRPNPQGKTRSRQRWGRRKGLGEGRGSS